MKQFNMILAALLVCGVAAVQAGQLSTTWTLRNVVDPPELRDGLNADAQAADARLDTIETAVHSATLISNKYLKVWHPNGSTTTTNLTAYGTVTLPSASIAAAALPGAITASTVFSNANAKAYILTLEVKSGGTVTVPSGSVALAALAGGAVKNGTASTTDLRIRYGTATNGQAVSWGETFTAVVFADIVDTNGTNAYFSAITTSGGTASVAKPHTNRWFVIGR
jgi:hypothetical protein